MKKSWIIIGMLAAVILAASFAGANWSTGYADTIPTVPTVPVVPVVPLAFRVTPGSVQVNGPAVTITITGKNFIDPTNTVVRWLGPDKKFTLLTTTSVSADQKSLQAVVPAYLLLAQGDAYLWIINHPAAPAFYETAGPLTLQVAHMYYQPVVMR